MTVVKDVSKNREHTLIPVTAKMIHSAIWDLERFVLKDANRFTWSSLMVPLGISV
jgi:hypothetical protein